MTWKGRRGHRNATDAHAPTDAECCEFLQYGHPGPVAPCPRGRGPCLYWATATGPGFRRSRTRARLPTTACRVSRARRRGTRVLRVPSCVLATSSPSPRILWVPSWVLATPPPSPPPLAPLVMMGRTAAHDASVA